MGKFIRLEGALERELSSLIPTLQDPRIPLVVTVERVKLSPDGRQARVLVSSLEAADQGGTGQADLLAALNGAAGRLQHEIAADLALKFTPRLRFFGDPLEVLG